jgi:hypothetical protein
VPDKIDKPSDIEFAQAIVQHIPEAGKPHILADTVAAYIMGKAVKRVIKKR